jgi:hypothetical protein
METPENNRKYGTLSVLQVRLQANNSTAAPEGASAKKHSDRLDSAGMITSMFVLSTLQNVTA